MNTKIVYIMYRHSRIAIHLTKMFLCSKFLIIFGNTSSSQLHNYSFSHRYLALSVFCETLQTQF